MSPWEKCHVAGQSHAALKTGFTLYTAVISSAQLCHCISLQRFVDILLSQGQCPGAARRHPGAEAPHVLLGAPPLEQNIRQSECHHSGQQSHQPEAV